MRRERTDLGGPKKAEIRQALGWRANWAPASARAAPLGGGDGRYRPCRASSAIGAGAGGWRGRAPRPLGGGRAAVFLGAPPKKQAPCASLPCSPARPDHGRAQCASGHYAPGSRVIARARARGGRREKGRAREEGREREKERREKREQGVGVSLTASASPSRRRPGGCVRPSGPRVRRLRPGPHAPLNWARRIRSARGARSTRGKKTGPSRPLLTSGSLGVWRLAASEGLTLRPGRARHWALTRLFRLSAGAWRDPDAWSEQGNGERGNEGENSCPPSFFVSAKGSLNAERCDVSVCRCATPTRG